MTVREVLRASLRLLDRRDRRLLGLATLVQMTTAILDLLGVMLIGIVGSLAVTAVDGQQPPHPVGEVVSALGLPAMPTNSLIALLAALAAALLMAKSVVSPLLMRRALRFLAGREVVVSTRLTRELLARPLVFIQRRSTQETASAIIQGVNSATMTVLGQMVAAASEIALLTLVAVALLIANPPLALGVIGFFGVVGFALQRVLGQRAARSGAIRADADIASLRASQEALASYREITVSDRRTFYVERIARLRGQASKAATEHQLVNMLPKYVLEGALVLGGFVLAAVLFTTEPPSVAAGTFALFIAAASRVMPSLLRLQTAALSIRAAAGLSTRTFALADDLQSARPAVEPSPLQDVEPSDFTAAIQLCDVSFRYPGTKTDALRDITLTAEVGKTVALVGRSGAGKSTLADIILGVADPGEGTASVGGVPPGEAVRRWPGAIAYVPQNIMLANDSVRNNVALGLPADVIDDDAVWDALRRAHLDDFVAESPEGLNTQVGERGLRLSGGQRQRLGIARALYTCPRLLVLDEATSSLDAETERTVTEMLETLEHDVTTVIIAHRLSTVRHADLVVYLEYGRILAVGSFDEVCARVPALRRQAGLMGLGPAGD